MRHRVTGGYSLVELLVGCALGLLLAGAALQLFARQVQAQREQLVEARLHQDLRATSDLVVRGLRRAGAHDLADAGASPYRAIELSPATLIASHNRDALDNGVLDERERAGFRVVDGGMQAMVGGRWQALTDPAVVRVVRFDLAMSARPTTTASDCATLIERDLSITIEAHPAVDPRRLRRVSTQVRVRNDDVDASACAERPAPPVTRSAT